MTETAAVLVVAARSSGNSELDLSRTHGHKSMLRLNGRESVSYVIDNARSCPAVSRVVLVSEGDFDADTAGADEHIRTDGADAQAVLAGLNAVAGFAKCIMLTGDLPLASPVALEDLIAGAPEADLVYPVVEKPVMAAAFPERTPYYVRAREGEFTGTSALLLRPEAALRERSRVTQLMEARSNPASLLGLFGAGFAMRMVFSTLSIADFEQALTGAVGLECRVYAGSHPEMFVSIDSPADLHLIERELGSRGTASA